MLNTALTNSVIVKRKTDYFLDYSLCNEFKIRITCLFTKRYKFIINAMCDQDHIDFVSNVLTFNQFLNK